MNPSWIRLGVHGACSKSYLIEKYLPEVHDRPGKWSTEELSTSGNVHLDVWIIKGSKYEG